ncbi:MAG: MFS transporter [Acetobacteraceae bacterium]|nr:MFS transporter [Acetobacteraceae bacterium]
MLARVLAGRLARLRIHYGWVMVAVTFLVMLSTAAALGVPGVMLLPLRDEFGWSVSSISGALALRLLLYGLMAPFAAALLARYGYRAVVTAALGLIASGLLLATLIDQPWMLWASWGLVLGLGSGLTAMVLGASVASRWFTERRGLVVGVLTASSATGQLAVLPLAAWLAEHLGWRLAVAPAVIACAVAGLLFLLLARNDPAELELSPYGEAAPPRPVSPPSDDAIRNALVTLKSAAGSGVFWILFGTFFVCGLSTGGIIQTHFIPLCHDFGMGEVEAASVLAMMGAFDFVGTIASGWLSDRFDNRWLLFWYYGLRGLSLVALPFMTFTIYGLSLFAVFYGLDWIATVPPTVKLAGQAFGRERGPLVFGWVFTGHQVGASVAALLAGVSRDVLASYLPAFYGAGLACLAAATAVLFIRSHMRRPALVGAD